MNDQLEIILVVVCYSAIAFGVMRYSYPKMRPTWRTHGNSDDVFHAVLCGLFFPLVIVFVIGYYLIRGLAWLITYQNHG
jgi:hypothetical protein